MKKVLITLVMSIITMTTFAQTESPKHRPFVYGGLGWTPSQDLSYSVEAGTWGITSPTSFSATFDATRNVSAPSKLDYWVGAKAYYTVYSVPTICYMVYVAPKMKLDGSNTTLIEYGFNPNYTLNDDLLLGVTLGNQSLAGSPMNMFVSAGFIYMFK